MVKNVGVVTGVENGIASVSVRCAVKCEGCACGMTRSSTTVTMKASTGSLGVREGDSVVIATRGSNVVRDGMLVFVLPLVLGFTGYQIGAGFISQSSGIIMGILFPLLPLGYLFLRKRVSDLVIEHIISDSEKIETLIPEKDFVTLN